MRIVDIPFVGKGYKELLTFINENVQEIFIIDPSRSYQVIDLSDRFQVIYVRSIIYLEYKMNNGSLLKMYSHAHGLEIDFSFMLIGPTTQQEETSMETNKILHEVFTLLNQKKLNYACK